MISNTWWNQPGRHAHDNNQQRQRRRATTTSWLLATRTTTSIYLIDCLHQSPPPPLSAINLYGGGEDCVCVCVSWIQFDPTLTGGTVIEPSGDCTLHSTCYTFTVATTTTSHLPLDEHTLDGRIQVEECGDSDSDLRWRRLLSVVQYR